MFGDAWVGSIKARNAKRNDSNSVEIHKHDSTDHSGRLDQSDDLQWCSYETDRVKYIMGFYRVTQIKVSDFKWLKL